MSSRPSTALSTDTAGVMSASQKKSAVPASASPIKTCEPRAAGTSRRCASASSARMPPSPSLSARIMTTTYLSVTEIASAQKMSDSTPRIAAGAVRSGRLQRQFECVDRARADIAVHDAGHADDRRQRGASHRSALTLRVRFLVAASARTALGRFFFRGARFAGHSMVPRQASLPQRQANISSILAGSSASRCI
jgi:hypothetical protein